MHTITIAYLVGTVAMLLGIPPCLLLLGEETEGRFGYLLGIPGFAAVAYGLMALGVGVVEFQGFEVSVLRYVDWLVTTPLLVGYTAYVAGFGRQGIAGLVVIDVLMIVSGAAAVALAPPLQWAAFGSSSVFFLLLLGLLYGPMRNEALKRRPARRRLARILVNWVGLLWVVYPVVWTFGPGLKMISAAGISIMIVYLDVISKVTYVYLVYRSRKAFETRGEESPEALSSAGLASAPAS